MRIGIISDTHGLLRPEAIKHLAGMDHVIHAGDIGAPEVIEGLRKIAPTTVLRGNIDAGEWAKDYPDTELVVLGGRALYVLHNLKEIKLDPAASGFDVIISGHSHRPKIETKNGVLYLNPGSAGPRRFKLPVALAILEPDPKGCCVAVDCVIHGNGIHRDGERQCGRRSTAGPIGGRGKDIRAIYGMQSGRGWSR